MKQAATVIPKKAPTLSEVISGRLDLKYVPVGCRGSPTMYGNSGRVELNIRNSLAGEA